ncbi:MAG: hypothetical protein RR061_06225 [Muribaculaceae bacterium]
MDAKMFFDAENYFNKICLSNKLAQAEHFYFCTCSGIESLEGPLDKFRKESSFFCIDDTNDGVTFRGANGGYFKKRTFTVFILSRYKFASMGDRASRLAICRNMFMQVCSKLLIDEDSLRNDLIYLNTSNILSRELGQYFMSGCTGLYFMVDVSEPVDLEYNTDDWL